MHSTNSSFEYVTVQPRKHKPASRAHLRWGRGWTAICSFPWKKRFSALNELVEKGADFRVSNHSLGYNNKDTTKQWFFPTYVLLDIFGLQTLWILRSWLHPVQLATYRAFSFIINRTHASKGESQKVPALNFYNLISWLWEELSPRISLRNYA